MRRKTILTISLVVVTILIVVRLTLPTLVTWYVNRTLDRIPGYEAALDSIDLDLYRAAYRIHGIRVHKLGGRVPLPLLEVKTALLSLHTSALLQGKVVGRIDLQGGSLNFVNGRSADEEQLSVTKEWLEAVKDLFPLRINHFTVRDFDIRYRDPYATPLVDVRISDVRAEGRNFSNTRSPAKGREARIFGIGLVEGTAPIAITSTLAPSARRPTFELMLSLERLPLQKLNELFNAYGSFDVERGSGDFYIWMNVDDGKLKGTFKPLIHDIAIFSTDEEKETLLAKLWEAVVGAAAGIFENKQEQQIATVVPLEGDVSNVQGSGWTAIVEIVKNAFFEALRPGITEEEKEKG